MPPLVCYWLVLEWDLVIEVKLAVLDTWRL
jgi:hypothetical protein